MKILWLAPYPHRNIKNAHPAPWITTLAKELANNKDIELTVLSTDKSIPSRIDEYKNDKIKFIYLKVPRSRVDLLTFNIIRINILKNYLRNNYKKYDIIHMHGSEHQYETVAYDINIPKILSLQGVITECIKVLPMKYLKRNIQWKISSHYEKKYLRKQKHFLCRTHWDTAYIKSINFNAIIYKVWEMIRPEFFTYRHEFRGDKILFMGGTNFIKGYEHALIAFNEIRSEFNLKMILLGTTSNSLLKNTIQKHNLNNLDMEDLELWGLQDTNGILKAYSESFCLLHPSYIDNSPNSICEAQVAGLPVIASDVGGVSSLIEQNKTGILSSIDTSILAKSIEELYINRPLQRELSKNSRLIAQKRHNAKQILNQTLDMYKEIIENSKFN